MSNNLMFVNILHFNKKRLDSIFQPFYIHRFSLLRA